MKDQILKISKATHDYLGYVNLVFAEYKRLLTTILLMMVSVISFAEDAASKEAAADTFCEIWGMIEPWIIPAVAIALLMFFGCYVPLLKELLTAKAEPSYFIIAAIIIFSAPHFLKYADHKWDWGLFASCTAAVGA